MLCSERALRGTSLLARDGEAGRVHELYVDETNWQVNTVVIDNGNWPVGRLVLLGTNVIEELDVVTPSLKVGLTRDEVAAASTVSSHPPATLHREAELHAHHDWPVLWTAGNPMVSRLMPEQAPMEDAETAAGTPVAPHLLGTRDISGYQVVALDGDAGQVDDLLVDCSVWTITSIVVAPGVWRRRQPVIVPIAQVRGISRDELKLNLGVPLEELHGMPPFDSAALALPGSTAD